MSTVFDIDAEVEHSTSFFDFYSREGVRMTERLERHTDICTGCTVCWDNETTEAEGWRGI